MEYLLGEFDWLHEVLESFQEDDYLLLIVPDKWNCTRIVP
jgi:hypothetical protein